LLIKDLSDRDILLLESGFEPGLEPGLESGLDIKKMRKYRELPLPNGFVS
jgi:hypothetical protein